MKKAPKSKAAMPKAQMPTNMAAAMGGVSRMVSAMKHVMGKGGMSHGPMGK